MNRKYPKIDKPIYSSISSSLRGVEIGNRKVEGGILCERGLEKGGGLWFFSTSLLALCDFLNYVMFHFDLKKNLFEIILPFKRLS